MTGDHGHLTVLDAEAASRRGTQHTVNEDGYLVLAERGIFCVADGMGGHRDGEGASRSLIQALDVAAAGEGGFEERIRGVETAILAVNEALHAPTRTVPGLDISGTTVVVLLVGDGYACCLWAGDSRLYLVRSGRLYLVSEDHVAAGGALTRAVGAGAHLVLDRRVIEIAEGDVFLLCTDGLLKGIGEDDMLALIGAPDGHPAERLIAKAVSGGSNDDITLVMAWIGRHG